MRGRTQLSVDVGGKAFPSKVFMNRTSYPRISFVRILRISSWLVTNQHSLINIPQRTSKAPVRKTGHVQSTHESSIKPTRQNQPFMQNTRCIFSSTAVSPRMYLVRFSTLAAFSKRIGHVCLPQCLFNNAAYAMRYTNPPLCAILSP